MQRTRSYMGGSQRDQMRLDPRKENLVCFLCTRGSTSIVLSLSTCCLPDKKSKKLMYYSRIKGTEECFFESHLRYETFKAIRGRR